MDRSEQINELAAALSKVQAALPNVLKDKTAKIQTKTGKDYSYRYTDLASVWDACRKPLTDNELSLVQTPGYQSGSLVLETMLLHSSGQFLSSHISVRADDSDLRSLGSAITYLRRYALSAMLGIVTDEDDDAEAAARQQQNGYRTAVTKAQNDSRDRQVPANAADAQKRFLIWFAQNVGGDSWEDVARYMGDAHLPKPTTTDGWRALVKDVQERMYDEVENSEKKPAA